MKKFSPASITALKDALINIYWKKQDLKNFLKMSIKNDSIINSIDWELNKKFQSVNELIDRMVNERDKYYNDLISLIYDVSNIEDFSHLKIWPDSEIKISKAKESVKKLRQYSSGYFQIEQEKKDLEKRRKQNQEKLELLKSNRQQIENLKQEFFKLTVESDHSKRGKLLEFFLNKLFTLLDLEPKKSFTLWKSHYDSALKSSTQTLPPTPSKEGECASPSPAGRVGVGVGINKLVRFLNVMSISDEQIDGAFTFKNNDYLLEAKWQTDPVETGDLKKFSGTVSDKLKNTLGLFVSINGFSKGAKELSGANAKSIILMDGEDLNLVLEQRIDLHHLLFRKRRHASETGIIYCSAREIMNE